MVQAKGIKMSTRTFNNYTPSIPRSQKVVGVIVGVCAFVAILVAIIAYLPEQPDFSPLITYLSEIRVPPAWPSIGYFPIPAH
jgi:hypothetical protein